MKELLTKRIAELVASLYQISDVEIEVNFPNNENFGDYTTNIAMKLAKELKKNPAEIATKLADALNEEKELTKYFASFSTVGGFINASLSSAYLHKELQSQKPNQHKGTGKRILVEYGQPNTHKLPHIGHLFSYIVGDSVTRLLDATGNTVMKVNYEGDIGPHVAKALYGWIQKGKPDPKDQLERVRLLQHCYQEGSKAYEEDEIAKETIDGINVKLYNQDKEYVPLWRETRQWSVDYYKEFESALDVQQTYHYWESEVWKQGEEIVKANIGKGFVKSNGAVIFPGSEYGFHDRVFLTKRGTPTYEAKEIGLNTQKYKDWPFDLDIITTATEQNEYFNVVIKAIETAVPELKGKMEHIGFGMVSLSTGKMSSRSGNILSAIDLIEEVKNQVLNVINERDNLSEDEKSEATKKITMGAIKFAFLKQNVTQNIKFDIEESISFEGKSGPYIQYSYARIKSLIAQNNELEEATSKDWELLTLDTERSIMRWLHKYPTIVNYAAETRMPHMIAEYIYELSQKYNSYYANTPINSAETDELIRARRTLSLKVAEIIKSGLNLLGISAVDKM